MKKSILNLAGAQELSKKEQRNINGGITKSCADAWAAGTCYTTPNTSPCLLNGEWGVRACGKCCY